MTDLIINLNALQIINIKLNIKLILNSTQITTLTTHFKFIVILYHSQFTKDGESHTLSLSS